MFRRLVNWLFNRQTEQLSTALFGVFTQKDRYIYHYHDGTQLIHADPQVIYQKIMDVGPELQIDMRVATSPMKDAPRAHSAMINKIRHAFDIKELSQGGLNESETVDLLDHFLEYVEQIKKTYELASDMVDGSLVTYCDFVGKVKPSYIEYFGFWLNKRRVFYRKAASIAFGVGVANGNIEPGMEYYKSITDGEGEAMALKAQYDMARRAAEQE